MDFSGINSVAAIVAAIAGFIFGAAYYGVLGKPWMKAARIVPGSGPSMVPLLINSLICEIIMAFVLALFISNSMAGISIASGLMTALVCWLGFVLTTTAVNQRYEGFGWGLTIIDAAHWLGVMLIMGAVIGWWG